MTPKSFFLGLAVFFVACSALPNKHRFRKIGEDDICKNGKGKVDSGTQCAEVNKCNFGFTDKNRHIQFCNGDTAKVDGKPICNWVGDKKEGTCVDLDDYKGKTCAQVESDFGARTSDRKAKACGLTGQCMLVKGICKAPLTSTADIDSKVKCEEYDLKWCDQVKKCFVKGNYFTKASGGKKLACDQEGENSSNKGDTSCQYMGQYVVEDGHPSTCVWNNRELSANEWTFDCVLMGKTDYGAHSSFPFTEILLKKWTDLSKKTKPKPK